MKGYFLVRQQLLLDFQSLLSRLSELTQFSVQVLIQIIVWYLKHND
jgi:hypothetical protein